MAHDWESITLDRFGAMATYGARRCRNCRKEQTKRSVHLWMRVVGYRWHPLAGRCKGKAAK